MKSINIFLFMLLGLASCEKIAQNVDPPVVEQQLVLYSFISPEDSLIKVELTLSNPIFDGDKTSGIKQVTDATVILKDAAGNSTSLTYDNTFDQYMVETSTFPIVPGQTYYITATSGDKTVKANCTVPLEKVEISSAKYQKAGQPSPNYSGPYYRYSYEWQDVGGKASYYLTSTVEAYPHFNDITYDTVYYDICEGLPVSDFNHDGGTMSGICEDFNFYGGTASGQEFSVAIFLLTTDVHYYEYHRRRIPYEQGDPFSEPYQQYSNVEGGLGVFCSFRRSKTVLTMVL